MVKAHLHANAPYCSVVRSKQSVLNVQSPHDGMRFCNYFYNVVCSFFFCFPVFTCWLRCSMLNFCVSGIFSLAIHAAVVCIGIYALRQTHKHITSHNHTTYDFSSSFNWIKMRLAYGTNLCVRLFLSASIGCLDVCAVPNVSAHSKTHKESTKWNVKKRSKWKKKRSTEEKKKKIRSICFHEHVCALKQCILFMCRLCVRMQWGSSCARDSNGSLPNRICEVQFSFVLVFVYTTGQLNSQCVRLLCVMYFAGCLSVEQAKINIQRRHVKHFCL